MSEASPPRVRCALITGAGRGLGAELGRALAARGYAVGLVSRTGEEVESVAATIGANAIAVTADVSDPPDVERAVSEVASAFGPIELLVNNATVLGPIAPLWEADPTSWLHAVKINLEGALHCLRAVLPEMIAARRGAILGTTTGASTVTLQHLSAYSVSKAAFEHLHRMAHAEAAEYGVAVALVDPGSMDTPMMRGLLTNAFPDRPMFVERQATSGFRDPGAVAVAIADLIVAGIEPGHRYGADELRVPGSVEAADRSG